MPKYNEIVMIVHPLFRLLRNIKKIEENNKQTKVSKKYITKIKHALKGSLQRQFNNSISVYKKTIIETKKSQKSKCVIFEPKIPDFEHIIDLKLYDLYMKDFYNFSKKALGERVLIVKFDRNSKTGTDVFDNRIYKDLEKNVKLKALGEYADKNKKEGCVISWSELAEKELKKRGFKLISKKIEYTKSFSKINKLQRIKEVLKSKYKRLPNKKIVKRKINKRPMKPR
jgi:hypothetical protein